MAQIPRFRLSSLNPRIAGEDAGEAFARLVHETLRSQRPGLTLHPGPGKDGAIDLSETRDDGRSFLECKHIEQDGLPAATARWREVAKKLRKHLASPSGPTAGQAQYAPWYRRDPPLLEYVFCISSALGNLRARETLEDEIASFFAELSQHSHLTHLQHLAVDVIDWDRLREAIEQMPLIAYRWFPATRPFGAVPLDEPLGGGAFRSYLHSAQLPYFSVDGYRTGEAELPSESELVESLERRHSGLIITGRGGVGKTRLTLEVGRLAERAGWTALRVLPSFDRDALLKLAEDASVGDKVLLLVDYVELQTDFEEIAGLVGDLNETYGLHIGYVANCRGTYYPRLSSLVAHRRVNVSPIAAKAADEYKRYGHETVRHILRQSSVEISEEALAVCRDTPVLAVFLSYLAKSGREADLAELLNERNFGSWVAKRVQMSFQAAIKRELAILVALMPMPVDSAKQLAPSFARLLDTLIADGWAERESGDRGEEFVMAHDVLADQIIVSYVNEIAATADGFFRDVLLAATAAGDVQSALAALQRVAEEPALAQVDWLGVLSAQVTENPEVWQKSARILLTTPLLKPIEQIEILHHHGKSWPGIEQDVDVQNRLGWLARWTINEEEEGSPVPYRSALEDWVVAAAAAASRINYVITWALRLAPEPARAAALRWIQAMPLDFQTHYVLVAWLEAPLPNEMVADYVAAWASRFAHLPRLTFLVRAWLEADGDPNLVRDPINRWSKKHAVNVEAQFVYKAWLDATKELDFIREPIARWLEANANHLDAGFVYRTWLDASKEIDFVRKPITSWLEANASHPDARYVYKAWLDAGGELDFVRKPITSWLEANASHEEAVEADYVYHAWLNAGGPFEYFREPLLAWVHANRDLERACFVLKNVVRQTDLPLRTVHDILEWCANFPANEDALWRLTALGGRYLSRPGIGDQLLAAAHATIGAVPEHPDPTTRGQIAVLISFLISSPDLALPDRRAQVDELIRGWLRHPSSYGRVPAPHRGVQRELYVQRVVELFLNGPSADARLKDGGLRFLQWVEEWDPDLRFSIEGLVAHLRAIVSAAQVS